MTGGHFTSSSYRAIPNRKPLVGMVYHNDILQLLVFLLWEWSTWAESGLQLVALQLRDPQDGAWLGNCSSAASWVDVACVGHDNYDWVCVIYTYIYTYNHIYVYIYIYIYIYIYVHMHICICIYIYTHIYIYNVNTCRIIQYIHIYIYTYNITSRSSSIEGIISTSFICDDPFYCGNDIDESRAWLRWWYLSNWQYVNRLLSY